jgi:hypothetical protein
LLGCYDRLVYFIDGSSTASAEVVMFVDPPSRHARFRSFSLGRRFSRIDGGCMFQQLEYFMTCALGLFWRAEARVIREQRAWLCGHGKELVGVSAICARADGDPVL